VEAHRLDPTDDLVTLDLVGVDLVVGEAGEARTLVDSLPPSPAQRTADARVSEAEGRFARALERLPAGAEPALRRRLEVRLAIERAHSSQDLQRAARLADGDPELMGFVGTAWSEAGQPERAVGTLQSAVAASPTPALRLRLAAALLRAGRDAEFVPVAARLDDEPLDARQREDLDRLRIGYTVRRADALREQGEPDQAWAALAPALRDHPRDPALLAALGRLFQGAGAYVEARDAYAQALAERPDDLAAREGAVFTALAADEPDHAGALVTEGLRRHADDPAMQLLAGRYYAQLDEDDRALDALRRARDLVRPSADAPLALRAAQLFPGDGRDPSLPARIDREIDAVRRRHAVDVSGETAVRRRDGESGFGAVNALSAPLRVLVPLGLASQLAFTAEPILLDAETLALDDPDVAARFGALGTRADARRAAADQTAQGLGLTLAWRWKGLLLDAGSTPVGFPTRTIVGGLRWDRRFGPLALGLDVSRRSVEDSLLSFAGARDPATGRVWGGVVRTGGRVEVGLAQGRLDGHLYGGYGVLGGWHVETNRRFEAGAGADWALYDRDDARFTGGLALDFLAHPHDLSHFTFGQGGYFSPQRFLHFGVPFQWTGHARRLGWSLRAEPGVNWFREDAEAWYPLDADLQALRGATFPDRSITGAAFDTLGALTYDLGGGLEAALRAATHGARDYDEWTAGLSLRYGFRDRAP
jgi:tetratricopeptide (TPR) repeat protein